MDRIAALRASIKERRRSAILITNLNNIHYLTGFRGSSAYLVVTNKFAHFFTDFRYREQSVREVLDCEIFITKGDTFRFIAGHLKKAGIKNLSIEDTVSYRVFLGLSRYLPLKSVRDAVEGLRERKEKSELESIRKAINRAEESLLAIKPYIKIGVTEKAITGMLDEAIRKSGASRPAFDTIVAFGANSALPHARPSDKRLEPGEIVLLDWGAECDGYFSDMTRTFICNGQDTSKAKEIYEIVLAANIAGISMAQTAKYASDIDNAVRSVIKNAGYAEYFGHSTGHGVGMDVHETPVISGRLTKKSIEPDMVFTIEPGIYLPGIGGVRIEDMVCRGVIDTLTTLPKGLEII